MKKSTLCIAGVAMACVLIVTAGCESYGRAGGLGAALGAGTGAIIGHQSGHAGEGALIGAAVGGLAGLIAHDVKAKRARSREETAQKYDYTPAQGEVLQLEDVQVLPSSVKAGNMIESSIQYALLGTGGPVQVKETRALRRGGEVIAEISSKTFTRDEGTWVSAQQFRLPGYLDPGQYILVQTIQTPTSRISGTAQFNVI